MKPKHLVFPLLIVLTFMVGPLLAQCFEGVEYKTTTQSEKGSISLTFSKSYDNIEITLYDFYATNDKMKIATKKLTSVNGKVKIIAFKDLKLSSYLLKLEYDDCIKYIGGMEGINFNDK